MKMRKKFADGFRISSKPTTPAAGAPLKKPVNARKKHNREKLDKLAEEVSENEGMPEHSAKSENPVLWNLLRWKRTAR